MSEGSIGDLGLVAAQQGKYRILLFYEDDFSASKVNRGILVLFLSGKHEDAEGDTKVYECPNPQCIGVLLPDHYDKGPMAICPRCHRTWLRTQLVGEMVYDATVDGWATHIERYMRALKMDCDIFLKRAKTGQSIIEADMIARHDPHGKDLLTKARKKEEALFTMGRIIAETSAGKPLHTAIRDFLLA